MTRGTLFYYESATKVWSSTEFNGDMYHGTPENPLGEGDKVIELMTNLNSVDDFKSVLTEINKDYNYDEGNDCYEVGTAAIKKFVKDQIKWIDEERPDLKGDKNYDPREFEMTPTIKDVRTWQYWGVPNMSDYSYIYNNSGKKLTIITHGTEAQPVTEIVIPNGAVGVLNYGHNDCICKDGKIIDGMGNYKVEKKLGTKISFMSPESLEEEEVQFDTTDPKELAQRWWEFCQKEGIITAIDETEVK